MQTKYEYEYTNLSKILSVLLTLAMILTLIPFAAIPVSAALSGTLIIGGATVDLSANKSGTGWSWDIWDELYPRLYLTSTYTGEPISFNFDSIVTATVYYTGNVTINGGTGRAIDCNQALYIYNSPSGGTLTLTSSGAEAIYADKIITIYSGTLIATGGSSSGAIVSENGKVNLESASGGINATISGGIGISAKGDVCISAKDEITITASSGCAVNTNDDSGYIYINTHGTGIVTTTSNSSTLNTLHGKVIVQKGTLNVSNTGDSSLLMTTFYKMFNGTLSKNGGIPPIITSISPSKGSSAGGTDVTLTGQNFTGATRFTIWDNQLLNMTIVSDTSITGKIPQSSGAGNSNPSVFIETPDGATARDDIYAFPVTPIPQFVSAATNSDGTKVLVTFDMAMGVAGRVEDYTVMVGGVKDIVTATAVNGTDSKIVELTLTTPITSGATVTVAYNYSYGVGYTVGQISTAAATTGDLLVALSPHSPSMQNVTNNVGQSGDTTAPVLSAGSVNRTSDTAATIGFTTDQAGTAYYIVVASGAAEPTNTTVKAGTSLGAVTVGANTGKAVILTAGAKDVYVVVEDAAGNISTPLKIPVAAYGVDTAPGTPRNLKLIPGDRQITVEWDTPTSDGGAAIIGYTLQFSGGGDDFYESTDGAARSCTRKFLTNGTEYTVIVWAFNGQQSDVPAEGTCTPGEQPITPPGTPRYLALTPGDKTIKVEWSSPVSDGGTAITKYLIRFSVGDDTIAVVEVDGNERYYLKDMMVNGTEYMVEIWAFNGAQSDTPANGKVTPGGCTVTFNANGGTSSEATRTVNDGAAIGTLPTATRSGYTFGGWFTAAVGGTKILASQVISGDVTYYAQWTYTGGDGGGTITPPGGGDTGGTTPTNPPAESETTTEATTETPSEPEDDDDTITLPDGSTINTPDGEDPVENDDGSITLSSGGTVTTLGGDDKKGGTKIDVPAGTVIDKDGTITFPEGSGGGTITDSNGFTFSIDEDAIIILDPDTPLGYTIFVDNPFDDVNEDDWFYDYVMFMYSHGLMNGTGTEQFDPNMTTTQGMLVTMLYRLAGSPDGTDGDKWYSDAVKWAMANGIIDDMFDAEEYLSREYMAVILTNFIKYIGFELPNNATDSFKDESDISPWALEAVKLMQAAGIIVGRPGGIYDPQGTATRAEIATIIVRFIELSTIGQIGIGNHTVVPNNSTLEAFIDKSAIEAIARALVVTENKEPDNID